MSDRNDEDKIPIKQPEFTELLGIQMDASQYLHSKSSNILRYLLGLIAIIVAAFSADLLGPIQIVPNPDVFTTNGAEGVFLNEMTAKWLSNISLFYYVILFLGIGGGVATVSMRIVKVYRHVGFSPVINRETDSFAVVNDEDTSTEKLERLLNENDRRLSKQYNQFREAGILIILVFFYLLIAAMIYLGLAQGKLFLLIIGYVAPLLWFNELWRLPQLHHPRWYWERYQEMHEHLLNEFEETPESIVEIHLSLAQLVIASHVIGLVSLIILIGISLAGEI